MASFDKFIKDLERRAALKKAKAEALKRQNDEHHHRRRVDLYSERWSNSVRYNRPPGGKKK